MVPMYLQNMGAYTELAPGTNMVKLYSVVSRNRDVNSILNESGQLKSVIDGK